MLRESDTLTALSILLIVFSPLLPAPVLLAAAAAGLILGAVWLHQSGGRA